MVSVWLELPNARSAVQSADAQLALLANTLNVQYQDGGPEEPKAAVL